MSAREPLVIGIGNEYRHDDAVGIVVACRLAALGVRMAEASGEGSALMTLWEGESAVIVVDASRNGVEPGSITRYGGEIEAEMSRTSHVFGLVEALNLCRALEDPIPEVVVFAVEGSDFGMGLGLSEAVERAVPKVVELVRQELRADLR